MPIESILLTRHDKRSWTAVCPEFPEHVTYGTNSTEALQRFNALLWKKHWEKEARLNKCHASMDSEIRRAAGIPGWALKLPSWLLWNKMEREHHQDRMDKIVESVCANPAFKDRSFEDLTDECIQQFVHGFPKVHPNHRDLDPDVVEILSR